MNEDHTAALNLYAIKLCNAADGAWRCTGIDPDGLDLQNGPLALRVMFPQRVTTPGALRTVLKELADKARTL
jgi:putative heme iron utilization protein